MAREEELKCNRLWFRAKMFGWNYLTPLRVTSFLVVFVVVNIIVLMTFFSSDQIIPPPKNLPAGKYLLGTKLSMIQFSCSRWLLDVFIGDEIVSCGQAVPLNEFSSKLLSVKFSKAKDDSLYTLIMVDPDAPSPNNPYNKCWLHWILGNINGTDLRKGLLNRGETVVAYYRPTPPKGSGPHRYFLFLLEQPYKRTMFDYSSPQPRAKFNPDKFIEQYNFSPAIGTSYFVTEDK